MAEDGGQRTEVRRRKTEVSEFGIWNSEGGNSEDGRQRTEVGEFGIWKAGGGKTEKKANLEFRMRNAEGQGRRRIRSLEFGIMNDE